MYWQIRVLRSASEIRPSSTWNQDFFAHSITKCLKPRLFHTSHYKIISKHLSIKEFWLYFAKNFGDLEQKREKRRQPAGSSCAWACLWPAALRKVFRLFWHTILATLFYSSFFSYLSNFYFNPLCKTEKPLLNKAYIVCYSIIQELSTLCYLRQHHTGVVYLMLFATASYRSCLLDVICYSIIQELSTLCYLLQHHTGVVYLMLFATASYRSCLLCM